MNAAPTRTAPTRTAPEGLVPFARANAATLGAGALIAFTSTYGQTVFIAVFAGQLMAAFGLSDGGWGLVYTVATAASAAAMVFAGGIADRLRVRRLAVLVCIGLALACLGMAATSGIVTLALAIFALRFFGQGMMSHLAAVAMARWFVASRGKALSLASLGFALGQAAMPLLFVSLLAVADWRWLWVAAAALVCTSIPAILRLLRAERTPQAMASEGGSTGLDGRHWTRGEVLRHGLFWTLIPLLLGPPAFGTALFFHQVHLAAVKGWPLQHYVALIPVFTAVSVTATLVSGAILDRVGSARLIRVYLLPFALAFLVMAFAQTLWGAALALAIFGIGTGAQATVPTAFWAEFYGTRHIGSIKAAATAIMVFGTAVGPGITGVVIDAGIDLPGQMVAIAGYFAAAAALAAWGVRRALPSQVDVVGP